MVIYMYRNAHSIKNRCCFCFGLFSCLNDSSLPLKISEPLHLSVSVLLGLRQLSVVLSLQL